MNARILIVLLWFIRSCNSIEEQRLVEPGGFLVYRTVSIAQKSCDCPMPFSCSCCRAVIILYTKAEKNLCVNFTYQRNGFNVDVTLNSDTIKAKTLTDYKPLKFCIFIPGCLFSSMCVNVVELNQFPRSITVCLRLDIYSKKQLWKINYDCVSISTELPMMPDNATSRMIEMPPVANGGETTVQSTEMPTTAAMQSEMPSVAMMTAMQTESPPMQETTMPSEVSSVPEITLTAEMISTMEPASMEPEGMTVQPEASSTPMTDNAMSDAETTGEMMTSVIMETQTDQVMTMPQIEMTEITMDETTIASTDGTDMMIDSSTMTGEMPAGEEMTTAFADMTA